MFLLDLKIFEGNTFGEVVFEDQKDVLSLTEGDGALFSCFAVMDTTGSMGNLGSQYRENNFEYGYYI